jgi:hypothetical protein
MAKSVFDITPPKDVIPPMQKKVLKIEFYPQETSGLFAQNLEIETQNEKFDYNSNSRDSYRC